MSIREERLNGIAKRAEKLEQEGKLVKVYKYKHINGEYHIIIRGKYEYDIWYENGVAKSIDKIDPDEDDENLYDILTIV